LQIGLVKVGAMKISPFQYGLVEIGAVEIGAMEIGPVEFRPPQVDAMEIRAVEIGVRKESPLEVQFVKVLPVQVGPLAHFPARAHPRLVFLENCLQFSLGQCPKAGRFLFGSDLVHLSSPLFHW
jgi:hypothetical protein